MVLKVVNISPQELFQAKIKIIVPKEIDDEWKLTMIIIYFENSQMNWQNYFFYNVKFNFYDENKCILNLNLESCLNFL